MFNLIVTILALVLMIGAAIAGLTYLGPAFTNSQIKASYAAMLNASEQIQGAEALEKSDKGGTYATLTGLTPYYLSTSPIVPAQFTGGAGWSINAAADSSAAQAVLDLTGNPAAAAAVCALVPLNGLFGCVTAVPSAIVAVPSASVTTGAKAFIFTL